MSNERVDVPTLDTLVDIKKDIAWCAKEGVLDSLLKDYTMSTLFTYQTILWATDSYEYLGSDYGPMSHMSMKQVLMDDVIQVRALKDKAVQKDRARRKAEIFTPAWIVRKMNDMLMSESGMENADWNKLIDSTMLEITCGEGAFLVTRYDPATGRMIPLEERVGLLDRKLRSINENYDCGNSGYPEWMWCNMALSALESTYGYEWAGDSLLIARVNVLMTVCDFFRARWGDHLNWLGYSGPYVSDPWYLKYFAMVISNNLWQMDGLTGMIPNTDIPCVIKEPKTRKDVRWIDMGVDEDAQIRKFRERKTKALKKSQKAKEA